MTDVTPDQDWTECESDELWQEIRAFVPTRETDMIYAAVEPLLSALRVERDQLAEQLADRDSEIRLLKEQHRVDEHELVENTVQAHVRQMNAVSERFEAELAAARADLAELRANTSAEIDRLIGELDAVTRQRDEHVLALQNTRRLNANLSEKLESVEREVEGMRAQLQAVRDLCNDTESEVPCPFDAGCDDWFSAVACVQLYEILDGAAVVPETPQPDGEQR